MKKTINKKATIIIAIIIIIVAITLILGATLLSKEEEVKRFELDKFYDVYPEDIRALYTNILDVSCTGSLLFDIELNKGEYLVSQLNTNDLLAYIFAYIEKFEYLDEEVKLSKIDKHTKTLFSGIDSLSDKIKDFAYDGYMYNIKDDKLSRKSMKCDNSITYVTDLSGYFYTNDRLRLYMDVNVGYVKDNILYDLLDNKLGDYTSDISELKKILVSNTYYRFGYVNDAGDYKLHSVEWKLKG